MSAVWVTGAAQGIGYAIAQGFCEGGRRVALVDKRDDVGGKAQSLAGQGGDARGFRTDVSNAAEVSQFVEDAISWAGPPSVLVNNAGVGGPFQRAEEVSEDTWDSIVGVNLKGVFLLTRAVLGSMKHAGFGRIINIASIQGTLGAVRSSTYVASKHGVVGYTRAVAAEVGGHGITCNAIAPGYVDTAQGVQDDAMDNFMQQVLAKTPVGRIAEPREIARVVLHLADEEAGYINGAVITVDGGITCHVGIG